MCRVTDVVAEMRAVGMAMSDKNKSILMIMVIDMHMHVGSLNEQQGDRQIQHP